MSNPIAIPGTVVSSGAAVSPGGAQGVQGLTGASGGITPCSWAAFSYQSGWSQNSNAAYRLQTTGAFSQTLFKGSIAKANGTTTNLAIILPSGFRPTDTRRFRLAGQETNTSPDECLYTCMIDTSGNVNIYPVIRADDVWLTWSNLQTIWLDGVFFEI